MSSPPTDPPRRRRPSHRARLADLARDPWIRTSLGLAAAGILALGPGRLRPVWTPSIPVGLYHMTPVRPADPPLALRGEAVQLCLPAQLARWAGRHTRIPGYGCPAGAGHLAKFVVAVPGDTVEHTLAALIINGTPLPASNSHVRDTRGAPLHAPGAGPGTYVLAPGQVWIYAPDPYSLDSRLLGPIPAAGISGTIRPLWVHPRFTPPGVC